PLSEASRKIKELLEEITYSPIEYETIISTAKISELAISYEKLSNIEKEVIPIAEAAGQVCAETIIPYPPGIPLLLMGELITEEKLRQLTQLMNAGARFQGGSFLDSNQINIVKTSY
ncbi:MAG: arginine decarboxylase, partial [Neobacillus sp.]|nr:arginine decarboxylase [Neobacillus sp.]